jgi:hypothetical protein
VIPGDTIFFIEYNDKAWHEFVKKYPQLKEDPNKAIHPNTAVGIYAA